MYYFLNVWFISIYVGGTILRCFQGPGERREEFCPKELAAHGETESKRQIHEKAYPSGIKGKREIPFNWEGIRKNFLKEVGKRGSRGGREPCRRSGARPMPTP